MASKNTITQIFPLAGVGEASRKPKRGEKAGAGALRSTLSASERAAGWKVLVANRTPSIKVPMPRVVAKLTGNNQRFRRSLGKVISSRIG